MKVEVLSQKVICSNEDNKIHNYFAWPTVTRLHNGRLAMVASGFRMRHIDPFGKVILSYSEDEGKTWSRPSIIMDTPLDDRDAGIVPFGDNKVIVTSFHSGYDVNRRWAGGDESDYSSYLHGYLDIIEKEYGWEKNMGSTYRISSDNCNTFGPIMKIPVTCPHGPAAMPDGSLLYVGHNFSYGIKERQINCYKVFPDGTYEFLSEIENVGAGFYSYEPHTIVTENGKVIVHIRVETNEGTVFTIYQCESYDGGKSFTKPHPVLSEKGGAPAHIINHNGTLISAYGYRSEPYGIRVMFSRDQGETWDVDHILVENEEHYDMGYPASVALKDGSILTVYYAASYKEGTSSAIKQVIWRYQ